MTKYRIRLRNGRVIGPFIKSQLFELKSKGHIQGNEEAQIFPTGDWQSITKLDFFEELMDPNRTVIDSAPKEETFIIDISKLRNQRNQKEIDKHDVTSHKPMELTETVRMGSSAAPKAAHSEPKIELEIDIDQTSPFEAPPVPMTAGHDKTLINPVAQEEIRAMQKRAQDQVAAAKAEEERQLAEEESRKKRAEEAKLIALDESTQMIKLDNLGGDLLVIANEEEQKIELEAREIKRKRKREEREEEGDDDTSAEEAEKKKKKKILMILLVAGLLYAVLFPDSNEGKKPPFQHLPPQIGFPVPFDKADSKAAKIEYEKGKKAFAQGNYLGTVTAGVHFKKSYENDISNANNDALNMLVRTYAEQLRYSSDKLRDGNTIFNIIQGKRPFLVKDPNGVIGMNLFYTAINKHEAAADVVARFLKMQDKKVTQDLFAVYLKTLVRLGKVDLAKQFSAPLIKSQDKNRYTYESLIEYNLLNQENEKALSYTKEAMKKFPKLVTFQLLYADQMIKQKNFKEANAALDKADALSFENNKFYQAKFFEFKGLLLAVKGDVKGATQLFNNSLKIEDSPELRNRLADLNTTGDAQSDTDKLIAESKAYKHLLLAKDFYDKRRFELALSSAARATDALPGHIPSELFLSKVQLRLGLANQAIKTLEQLLKRYPDDKNLNYGLIEAYIDTYKFNDARSRIAIISGSDLKGTYEFASVNAKLFMKMGDSLQAISWLRNSINSNPLNDEDLFRLVELLLRKNSNFDMVRGLLNRCMELDPANVDYHIAHAKIIYEQQGDQAAIGYLLGLHEEVDRIEEKDADGNAKFVEKKSPGRFNDNPKILGEIAIFYSRTGKVKDYQAYRAKLESLPTRDKALYEYLIKMALFEQQYEEIPNLVEELLKVEPGDIEAMMTAGRVLFENNKYADATRWFLRVQSKMETYPKVQYYIAKIKFLSKKYDEARADVEKDLKANGDNDIDLALLGQIYVAEGKLLEAENAFKKAQKINPKCYEALVGMADISTKRNNFDMALDLYKRALKERQDEAVIHRKVGDVYRLLGQGSLAVESYKLYLDMHPEALDKPQIDSYINLMQ